MENCWEMFTAFMFLLEVCVSEYIKMNEGQNYFMPRNLWHVIV
jgi:hypothetical protein